VSEEEARLSLLQTELNSIQSAIRNFETVTLQIKGWCVTTSLAVGGFAVAYHKPALLLVGLGAVLGFFLINCQFKMFQRRFMEMNWRIDTEIKTVGLMPFLKGSGNFEVVGTASWDRSYYISSPIVEKIHRSLPEYWREIRAVNTFSLYLFIAFCLAIEATILIL
jgi:hypothetical protein